MHKNVNEHILTKEELRAMYETRRDLVSRVSSFGAEIPTTSLQWKREAHELEWIVRQMSWAPPWTPADPRTDMEEKSRACEPRVPSVCATQEVESAQAGDSFSGATTNTAAEMRLGCGTDSGEDEPVYTGEGATSKSFLFDLMKECSIPGTIDQLTYETAKANAVDGNRNDVITVCHEAPPGMFRTSKNRNMDSSAEAMFKERLTCLLYTSPSPRDKRQSRMPSSA